MVRQTVCERFTKATIHVLKATTGGSASSWSESAELGPETATGLLGASFSLSSTIMSELFNSREEKGRIQFYLQAPKR